MSKMMEKVARHRIWRGLNFTGESFILQNVNINGKICITNQIKMREIATLKSKGF